MAEWVSGASPPSDIGSRHGAAAVGNYIYLFGCGTSGTLTYIYNISANSWSQGVNMIRARYDPECIAYQGKIYVCGGTSPSSGDKLTRIDSFDPSNNSWTALAGTSIYPEVSLSCHNLVGGDIYALGSRAANGTITGYIQAYNIANNAWRTLSTAMEPSGWVDFASAAIGDNIYVWAGRTVNSDESATNTSMMKCFNVPSSTWSNKADSYFSSGQNNANGVFDGIIFAAYGSSAIYYEESANKWEYLPNLPASGAQSLTIVSGKIYVATSSRLFIYDFTGDIARTNVVNAGPQSGSINNLESNTFSWELDVYPVTAYQTSAEYQWEQIGGSAGDTYTVTGTRTNYTVPAGVFPNEGQIRWRVRATASNGERSDWTDWYILTISTNYMYVTSVNPAGGFQNEQEPIALSWEVDSDPVGASQVSAVVQWRNTTSGTGAANTINIPNGNQYVTVASNTFPNGSFQWRVQVTGDNGGTSEFTPWYTISTIDQPPLAPTNLNPSGGESKRVDGTKSITFTWRHNAPYSTPQRAFEIQVTHNGGASYVALSGKVVTSTQVYNSDPYAIVPIDPVGRIGWRVRTYNSDDVESPWSETVYIRIETPPDPPTWVSVEAGTNMPLASWIAPTQVSYDLKVTQGETVVYEYGDSTRNTFHQLEKPLEDGRYVLGVRVGSERGFLSDWSYYEATIRSTSRVSSIILTGEKIANGISLSWEMEVSPP